MKNITEVFIGVDVSKNNLDIFIYPLAKSFRINNSNKDITNFIKQLSAYSTIKFACEASGGYEKLLAKILKKNSYNCWIVDPRRIKGFIISKGCNVKTDRVDSKNIAEFLAKNSLEYDLIAKTDNEEALQSLVNRKSDLTQYLASEKTRFKSPSHELSFPSISKLIKLLEKEVKFIDKKISNLVAKDKTLSKRSLLLESIPGIGKCTAALLIAFVPELGHLNNNKIASLVGLAPYDRSSGNYTGKKFIIGGRKIPRNALYMCALATIKHHLPLKIFYDRLIAAKKPFKVAIVAVMRKLIVIANTILRKGEPCIS